MKETRSARSQRGFTLVELLISMAILSVIVVLLAQIVAAVSGAWRAGERQVETYQSGRAILELMGRELAQALISPQLQFVQSPTLPAGIDQATYTSSLFWQAGLRSSPKSNVCEVGYFLTRIEPTATSIGRYRLQRFFVPPDDARGYYRIFDTPPLRLSVPWVEELPKEAFRDSGDPASAVGTVSDGVLGLWIRCIDVNGDAIPWMSSFVKFNSAASFRPAIPGQARSFQWHDNSGSPPPTAPVHKLPAFVEITIVTLDSETLQRRPKIPATPTDTPGPEEMPDAVRQYNAALLASGIGSARTFTTRVPIPRTAP